MLGSKENTIHHFLLFHQKYSQTTIHESQFLNYRTTPHTLYCWRKSWWKRVHNCARTRKKTLRSIFIVQSYWYLGFYLYCLFQCCGSVICWYGSGSTDPYLTNGSGSCNFRQWPSRWQLIIICYLSFLAYYFLKLHLNNFSRIKSH